MNGVETGMVVSDARAIYPSLKISTTIPNSLKDYEVNRKMVHPIYRCRCPRSAQWSHLDVSGCAHLWGGERHYIKDINTRLINRGLRCTCNDGDTIGAAWAIAHYGETNPIVESGKQMETLLNLSPAALRLEPESTDRLMKLGLRKISQFINMPRPALRRRFGPGLILKLDQALGNAEEPIKTVQPIEPFRERLPCLEPIVTSTGIEIALERLLETVCHRLMQEGKGIRKAIFIGYRVDNKIEKIEIGTNRATHNQKHLFKLFAEKISSIEPALGIELFMLEALKTEKLSPKQEKLWDSTSGLKSEAISELMDRLMNRFGPAPIHRFQPDEHHWPERSYKKMESLFMIVDRLPLTVDRPRPLHLLKIPEHIEVTAPIPDYPPMNFRYLGKLHTIKKADGPERIEPEWWIAEGCTGIIMP
jgi:protein ImuB